MGVNEGGDTGPPLALNIAIFAFSNYRKAASVQVISDVLMENEWFPAFKEKVVEEKTEILLEPVLWTLSVS